MHLAWMTSHRHLVWRLMRAFPPPPGSPDLLAQWLEESMDQEARDAAASSEQEDTFYDCEDVCSKCGHDLDSQECCRGKRKMSKGGENECATRHVRIMVKSAGCQTCGGPCQQSCNQQPQEDEHQEELDELNQAGGNWRHKRARNIALQEAALRPRPIPTVEQAVTPAQMKMAALAAKFRK